jgi:hypothetical protein
MAPGTDRHVRYLRAFYRVIISIEDMLSLF